MTGLSPRVRGNPIVSRSLCGRRRSIPARAGEPSSLSFTASKNEVYPRACGGTHPQPPAPARLGGLSPRVRGNPRPQIHQHRPARSIPARAGEPASQYLTFTRHRVYPRACGGTWALIPYSPRCWGLFPRVRGNPPAASGTVIGMRSIPARAGEPRLREICRWYLRVYPRACGGT